MLKLKAYIRKQLIIRNVHDLLSYVKYAIIAKTLNRKLCACNIIANKRKNFYHIEDILLQNYNLIYVTFYLN